ncbi:MAG: hypothetical protein JZU50_11830 [Desulfobulbaceae bacterium]|nr:hypothetical protein [Desulfobulbaceae bacterium]
MSTILGNLRQLFKDLSAKKGPDASSNPSEMNALFRFRYTLFKELLAANSELLTALSDMDEKLKGEQVFGLSCNITTVSLMPIAAIPSTKTTSPLPLKAARPTPSAKTGGSKPLR